MGRERHGKKRESERGERERERLEIIRTQMAEFLTNINGMFPSGDMRRDKDK
jgi:hypothetical protein